MFKPYGYCCGGTVGESRLKLDTFTDRQKYYAFLIRSLGEMYGYTPQQIGEMTMFQVAALCAQDPQDAQNKAGGVITVGAEKWASMTQAERRALRHGF